jgi:plasmid stabilization system protein ParE
LIGYTQKAARQVRALYRHYEKLERVEASRKLTAALAKAAETIESNPGAGLPSPRPYPGLAQPETAWIKVGRYWVAYRITNAPLIVGVFYEAADIPNRI